MPSTRRRTRWMASGAWLPTLGSRWPAPTGPDVAAVHLRRAEAVAHETVTDVSSPAHVTTRKMR
ncbi:MAG: hypothetical protein AVDCRST_MAG59-4691 [uncultured Thermomicrobiales bacterium]|uniref:Uncharacterized protein n=1 Tax=uncultured Thermomicrobiales bacterium TaxID=1645740 RepID=A0A6J4VMT7_9BACT|nr:MAG: hypothetical protein AVDCRST_MAG59-4691 [uncultured Thermomicrobiales bacterium]